MTEPSLVQMARAALGASTQTSDPEVATFYVASARIAFAKAKEELAQLETILCARERELAHRAKPKQLAIAEGA